MLSKAKARKKQTKKQNKTKQTIKQKHKTKMHYKTIELIAKTKYLSDEYMCMLYTYVLKSRGQAAIVSKMQAGSHLSSVSVQGEFATTTTTG